MACEPSGTFLAQDRKFFIWKRVRQTECGVTRGAALFPVREVCARSANSGMAAEEGWRGNFGRSVHNAIYYSIMGMEGARGTWGGEAARAPLPRGAVPEVRPPVGEATLMSLPDLKRRERRFPEVRSPICGLLDAFTYTPTRLWPGHLREYT